MSENEFVNGLSSRMSFSGEVPEEGSVQPIEDLGKSLTLVEDRKVEFTVKRAEELLRLPEFVVQDSVVDRNLRDAHVTYLLSAMQRGTFHPEWVQIVSCVCDEKNSGNSKGTEYRMNGQHTAWARIYMDNDWPCPVRWLVYRAATVQDMRRLYASIDRGAARNFGNVINSYLAGTSQFKGIGQDRLKRIVAGFAFWHLGGTAKNAANKIHPDDIAYLVQTEHTELTAIVAAFCQTLKSGMHTQMVMRSPVIAALYETFNVLKIKSAEFWEPVRDGTGLESKNDPRLRLRNLLMTTNIEDRANRRRLVDPEELYRICIHAWNAWRRGVELSNLRGPTDSKRPKAK